MCLCDNFHAATQELFIDYAALPLISDQILLNKLIVLHNIAPYYGIFSIISLSEGHQQLNIKCCLHEATWCWCREQ